MIFSPHTCALLYEQEREQKRQFKIENADELKTMKTMQSPTPEQQ